MAQSEGGLSGVIACPEKLKFELGLERAHACRHFGFNAESGLSDAEVSIAVCAKLILIGRKLGRTHDVEPVRVHLLEVISGIHHDEAVNIQRRLGLLRLRIGRFGGLRANQLAAECQDEKKEQHSQCVLNDFIHSE